MRHDRKMWWLGRNTMLVVTTKATAKATVRATAVTPDDNAGEQRYAVNAYGAEVFMVAVFNRKKTIEFENNDVYLLTKTELITLLHKARLFVSKRVPSKTENVTWVWFKERPKLPQNILNYIGTDIDAPASVTAPEHEFQGIGRNIFAYIASMLYAPLKRPIVLSVPHRETATYKPDGPFQIYIWSSRSGCGAEREARPPDHIWGHRVCCQDRAFVPPKHRDPKKFKRQGIVLRDGNYAVAELFPNALYVHHDLVETGRPEEFELFAELLHRCLPFLMSPEAFEEYRIRMEKAQLDAEKEAFSNLVQASVAKRATRQEKALATAERVVALAKQEYFNAEQTLFAEHKAKLDPALTKAQFIAEYEKLNSGKVDCIIGVKFDPSRPEWITIHTDEIVVEHPRTRAMHLIGKCNISFHLEYGTLKIVNLDRPSKNNDRVVHTPHVFHEDGRDVCLGNIEQELLAYIAHYEIEAATVLTVAFLQSCRNDEAYIRRLELFPVVETMRKAA